MRRIPLLLVVMAGVLTLVSGSALAAAVRIAASPPLNSSLPTITRHCEGGSDPDGVERLVERRDADRLRLPVAALRLVRKQLRLDQQGDESELRRVAERCR